MTSAAPAPPPSGRWTPAHKEAVVVAVREGHLDFDAAVQTYDLSADELQSWLTRFEKRGRRGLAVGRIQERGQ